MSGDYFALPRERLIEMYMQRMKAATLLFFGTSELAGAVLLNAAMFCAKHRITGPEIQKWYQRNSSAPKQNQLLDKLSLEEESLFQTLISRALKQLKDDKRTGDDDNHE